MSGSSTPESTKATGLCQNKFDETVDDLAYLGSYSGNNKMDRSKRVIDANAYNSTDSDTGRNVNNDTHNTVNKASTNVKTCDKHGLKDSFKARALKSFFYMLSNYWFPPLLIFMIFMAYLNPDIGRKGGYIFAEYTIKTGCTLVIFVIAGMSLRSEMMAKDFMKQWRAHIAIQSTVFIICPLLALCVGHLLLYLLQSLEEFKVMVWVIRGFMGGLCMPTAVSSNVVLSKAAGGSETLSVINSCLSLFIGLILSPFLLTLSFETTKNYGEVIDSVDNSVFMKTFWKILVTTIYKIILPFAFGVALRMKMRAEVIEFNKKLKTSIILYLMLICLVYSSFCDSFHDTSSVSIKIGFSSILLAFCIALIAAPTLMVFCYFFSRVICGLTIEQAISSVFAAPTRALTFAISLFSALLGENSSNLCIFLLPVLIHHSCQLTWGTIAVPTLKKYTLKNCKNYELEEDV